MMSLRAKVRELTSDALENVVSRVGTRASDPTRHATPKAPTQLTTAQLDNLCADSGLMSRVVGNVVSSALRGGWEWRAGDSEEALELPEGLDEHRVRRLVRETAIDARREGGALLWFINADSDQEQPSKDGGAYVNLMSVSRREATPVAWYSGIMSGEDLGEVEVYSISPHANGQGGGRAALRVHASRLLRFHGAYTPRIERVRRNGWDYSVVQSVYASYQRLETIDASIARTVGSFETAVMAISGLAAIATGVDGAKSIMRRLRLVQQAKSVANAVVIDSDAGESYNRNYANVSGLAELRAAAAGAFAAEAGESVTMLHGLAPTGAASDDEVGRSTWRLKVESYRSDEIEPILIQLGKLLFPDEENISVYWRESVEAMTPREAAEVGAKEAEAYAKYVGALSMHPDEVRPTLKERGLLAASAPAKAPPRTKQESPEPDPEEGDQPGQPTDQDRHDPDRVSNQGQGGDSLR